LEFSFGGDELADGRVGEHPEVGEAVGVAFEVPTPKGQAF
jgi:hypothetical protein